MSNFKDSNVYLSDLCFACQNDTRCEAAIVEYSAKIDINSKTAGEIDFLVRETADVYNVDRNDGSVSVDGGGDTVIFTIDELESRLTDGQGNVTAVPLLFCRAG